VAATTLAGQLMAALDQWDSGAALATMAPDQRTLARAAWLAAEGVQKQQNVAVHLTDLTYECVQSEDGSTSAAVTGTVVILDRESGAEKQRISDVNLEIAVAQQGETWYLLVDLPDIMGRLQPAQGGE